MVSFCCVYLCLASTLLKWLYDWRLRILFLPNLHSFIKHLQHTEMRGFGMMPSEIQKVWHRTEKFCMAMLAFFIYEEYVWYCLCVFFSLCYIPSTSSIQNSHAPSWEGQLSFRHRARGNPEVISGFLESRGSDNKPFLFNVERHIERHKWIYISEDVLS